MPVKRARALCPEADTRPLVEARLRPAFEATLEVAGTFAARYEVQPPKAAQTRFLAGCGAPRRDGPGRGAQWRAALRDKPH